MPRKFGMHLVKYLPLYDENAAVLIGDVEFPYVTVERVSIPLPCGKAEVLAGLAEKQVTIRDEKQRDAFIDELLLEISPLAQMLTEAFEKRRLKK